MSLINEMLRDLDARHAAESERGGLSRNVRALPAAQAKRWPTFALPLAAALLGGAAVWLGMSRYASPLAEAPVPPTPLPAVAAPPLAPVNVTMPEPPPVKESPVEPEDKGLKLATRIADPIPQGPAYSAAPAAPAKPELGAARQASKPLEAPAPQKPSTASGQISKSATDGSGSIPEQAESEYRRGYAAIRRGASQEAGEALRHALKIYPGHAQARQALLSLLVEQRQWQDAEILALDGVALNPARSDWALLAARIQFERGEIPHAQETLAQYAAQARQNPDYQIFHALLLTRANRHAEAVGCYQAALAIKPNEGRWWYGLGRALDADHRESEARHAYEKARDSGNLPPELAQSVERRLR